MQQPQRLEIFPQFLLGVVPEDNAMFVKLASNGFDNLIHVEILTYGIG